jgi:diguanylate cyclase (GGDEF)-like protein/PAS domain S-box-containing protein
LTSRLTKSGGSQDLFNSPGQDRYLDLIENTNEIVYTHDLEGNFTSVSRAIQATTGYSREEVLRMNLSDLLAPESVGLSRRMVEQKLGSGSPTTYEVAVRRKDGRRVALEVTSRLLFQMGRPSGVLCLVRETNRLQPTDSTLRLLRSVVVNANDAVLIAAAKPADQLGGKIIYVNEAFCRMTGYSAEEAVGRTPRILLGPQSDRDHLDQVRQALSGLEPVRVELVNYRKDGTAYWVDVNFVPIMDEKDEFTHWVAVQRETTHRRRAEDLERDRNRVLELVARNEPLDVVLTQLAQMMERQCPDLQCSVLLLRNGQLEPEAGAKLPGDVLSAFQALNDHNQPASQLAIYREMPPGPQLGATWSVPILSGSGVVLGAFAISCGVSRKPAEEELGLIGKASRLAAIAIEQKQLTDKLAHQAHHDTLTGLPNRALFEERLQSAVAQAHTRGWHVAVLFVDLDRFKQVNDTLGHPAGDALLQQVAQRLGGCLRRTDTLARMGGDEFTILLTELRDPQYSVNVAQKLLDALKTPILVDGHELFVTASIGISAYPRDGRDAATLQRNADSAMYRAKELGRNNFQVFLPEISASILGSLEIENALRKALELNEFQLRYQPQVSLDGTLTALEALLVWNHPKLGVIPPLQFIPVAEESGLIIPIGNWVLREACRQNAEWQKAGHPRVKVAVNVSVMQFTRPGFTEIVAHVLKETGLAPSFLELELTESLIMQDVRESAQQLDRLRSLGVNLAIDDFGTGYSSLSALQQFPIGTLKIDQSFVRDVAVDSDDAAIVRTIIDMGKSLDLEVIAEGVEACEQLEFLRKHGCDYAQGRLFGDAMEAGKMLAILSDQVAGAAHHAALCVPTVLRSIRLSS